VPHPPQNLITIGFSKISHRPSHARISLLGAALLLDEMRVADDTSLIVINPALGQEATLFPQGGGRVRCYLIYSPETVARLQGEADAPRLIEECIRTGIPREHFNGARVVSPLASFDMTEQWVEHPYRDGVTLLGDAAGASDPSWGQGLSMTVRDVRVLSENLLASEDWEAAGHAYARARDGYFKAGITVEDWYFELFLRQGPEAAARRARALPLFATQPDRAPDHFFSGPDLPCDDRVRRRFFGEE
jgi:menaquinone-9 beta-reductase